jgi:AcrR family transcriptional regulator
MRLFVDHGKTPMSHRCAESPPDAKTLLLLAGERLFARSGLDGASLREIAAEAGQRNHHAVQYHFGCRQGLIRAIFEFRMGQMEERRAAMLAEAQSQGRLDDIHTLMGIVFLPQLDLPGQQVNHSYATFLCQYLLRNEGNAFGDFGTPSPPHLSRTFDVLRQRLTFLPERIAQRRLVTACFMFLNMLSTYSHDRARADGDESFDDAVADTLNQIVAATCAPLKA